MSPRSNGWLYCDAVTELERDSLHAQLHVWTLVRPDNTKDGLICDELCEADGGRCYDGFMTPMAVMYFMIHLPAAPYHTLHHESACCHHPRCL